MAQRIKLDMERIDTHYRVDEDGAVWSYRMGRYVKPTCGGGYYDYYYVSLQDSGTGMVSVHKLVARKYIGVCPEGKEVSHKDGNKMNNHWTNLEYLTHAENIAKSFREHGRINHWTGKKREPFSEDTKKKMALAKNKPVVANTGEIWGSIDDCATALDTYRKAIYNAIRHKRKLKKNGLRLQFVTP